MTQLGVRWRRCLSCANCMRLSAVAAGLDTSRGVRSLAVGVEADGDVVGLLGQLIVGGCGTDGRRVGGIALAHLVGRGVHGEGVWIVSGAVGVVAAALLAKDAKETAALGGARGVVVVRAGAKCLLLAAVADEHELHEGREDEEDAVFAW